MARPLDRRLSGRHPCPRIGAAIVPLLGAVLLGVVLLAVAPLAADAPVEPPAEPPADLRAELQTELPATMPWDLARLGEPPEVTWIGEKGPVRSLTYPGEPYRGKPTRVFAQFATPGTLAGDASRDAKLPAIVLVHGGGGTAFPEWAELWARRGYAAIAMDLAGKRVDGAGGPDQSDETKFGSMDEPVTEHWPYHAVANVIRAHSLLRSLPGVDPERTAITGISWGGYLTCIAASIDRRFKAAVPVYGCGYLHSNSVWLEPRLLKMPPEHRERWIELYDPSRYLASCRVPIFFLNGTNDFAYPLDSFMGSYRLVSCEKSIRVTVNMPHGHAEGWAPQEIGLFVDARLCGGAPLGRVEDVRTSGGRVTFRWEGTPALRSAALHATAGTGPINRRQWSASEARIEDGRGSADLPAGATAWFIAAADDRGAVTSSEVFLVRRKGLRVRETAGIRRFSYPVAALLEPAGLLPGPAPGARFRLLEGERPIEVQARSVAAVGERRDVLSLDFEGDFLPFQERRLVLEVGDVEAPEPRAGLRVEDLEDAYRIANDPHLTWMVPKRGFLRAVATPRSEYLDAPLELAVRLASGGVQPLRPPGGARLAKEGPLSCLVVWEGGEGAAGEATFASRVELEVPRAKSWARVTWTLADAAGSVSGLSARVGLKLQAGPTLVDFGARGLVYAALRPGQSALFRAGLVPGAAHASDASPWEVLRGPPGQLEPYVAAPLPPATGARATGEPAAAEAVEGWAHAMDRERCTALAVAAFGKGTRDRIEVAASGALEIGRDFAAEGAAPPSGTKSVTFWVHFVDMPPHVGAVTSPQSMLAPLEVQWEDAEAR
ncbi:MAG: acetylxylan esterase [Planctomycetes bacterium]|nr:acetylxylan esterase [Planctomycetota bacterium]